MAILAVCVTVLVLIVLCPIIWVAAFYEPKKYKKLIDLENQRRQIAREIVDTASSADWLTKWRFKRYLKKGGGFL